MCDGLAVSTSTLHCHREHIALLGVGTDLDDIAIGVGAGLTVGRHVGRVGRLVGAQRDLLGRAGDRALVRVRFSGGDLLGTGLIGERRDRLRVHGTGRNGATGDRNGAAGDLIGVRAVRQLRGRAGKVLDAAVRVRDNHAILGRRASVTFNHEAQVITAVAHVRVLANHGVTEVVDRHNLRILPQVGAGVAELRILGERAAAIAIRALAAGTIRAAILVRTVKEQGHAVLLGGYASPAVLDPFITEFLRDIRLAVGEVIMRFHPVDSLVFRHLIVLGEMADRQVAVLHAVTHLMAIGGVGDAAAGNRTVPEQIGVIGFTHIRVLKHLAILVLGAVLENRVPIVGLLAEHLVRQLDMLGSIIAEAVRTIGDRLLEQVGHTLGHSVILRVEIPQAGQLVLGAVFTIVVIGDLFVLVEVVLVAPFVCDDIEIRGEVVGHRVHDDTQTVLVCLLAHGLEFSLGTDHIVADSHVRRLVDVVPVEVPVTGAELAVVLNFDDRLGLD